MRQLLGSSWYRLGMPAIFIFGAVAFTATSGNAADQTGEGLLRTCLFRNPSASKYCAKRISESFTKMMSSGYVCETVPTEPEMQGVVIQFLKDNPTSRAADANKAIEMALSNKYNCK